MFYYFYLLFCKQEWIFWTCCWGVNSLYMTGKYLAYVFNTHWLLVQKTTLLFVMYRVILMVYTLYLHGAIGSRRLSQTTVVKFTHDMVTLEKRSGYLHSFTGPPPGPAPTDRQSMYSAQLSDIGTMSLGLAWQYWDASAGIGKINLAVQLLHIQTFTVLHW